MQRDALTLGPKPCAGQRRHEDKLDGYTFDFPDVWIPVTVRMHRV